MMEEALPELTRTRQDGLLLSWARALPDSVVRRSPVLCIVSGWSFLMAGDLDALESRLDDADAALAEGARDPDLAATWADTDQLRTAPATISVYRASLAQARGDVAGTGRHARRVLELAGPEDHLLRGSGGGFLGLAAWAAGDLRDAQTTFSEAMRSLHAAGNLVDELDGTVNLADMWVVLGRPSRARQLCEQSLKAATERGDPHLRAAADMHVGLAELDRELDDLTSAEAHLERARVISERTSITENRHRRFAALAQLAAARGDVEAALRLLDEAEKLYRPGFYPDVRPIAAMRARVQIGAGDLASAAAWAVERRIAVSDEPTYLREYEHLTLARLLLAQHRVGLEAEAGPGGSPAAGALALLERMHTVAADARRDGSLLEIRVLRALAHQAGGDLSSAVAALRRAIDQAPEPEGYVRLFLDEGEPMLALLQHATSDAIDDAVGEAVQGQVRRLLERAGTHVEPQQSLADPLSQRELEVLRLLDSDLSGPEIARELYVTLNTLRTHTKRIFIKLDARTRAGAVHRAREHGLL
jgi:LuxR family maltose regulon positive regulatory protein